MGFFRRVASLTLIITLFLLGGAVTAHAQDDPSPAIARSFADLSSRVEPGMTVAVIDTAGNEVTGDLAEISASSLSLSIDETRVDLDEADVVRVSRPAHGLSRVLGGLIGFGAGLGVVAGVAALTIVAGENEGSTLDPNTANAIAWSVMLGGAALGAVLIHPTEEELLFQSGRATQSALALSVSPMLTKNTQGAVLSVTW